MNAYFISENMIYTNKKRNLHNENFCSYLIELNDLVLGRTFISWNEESLKKSKSPLSSLSLIAGFYANN